MEIPVPHKWDSSISRGGDLYSREMGIPVQQGRGSLFKRQGGLFSREIEIPVQQGWDSCSTEVCTYICSRETDISANRSEDICSSKRDALPCLKCWRPFLLSVRVMYVVIWAETQTRRQHHSIKQKNRPCITNTKDRWRSCMVKGTVN